MRICRILTTISFVILSVSQGVLAADLEEVSVVADTEQKQPASAKKDITEKAIEQASLNFIEQMIGKQKTLEQMGTLKSKIISQSGKYIPFVKAGRLKAVSGKYQMEVTLKIDPENLRTLMLQQGLLYKLDGPVKILPMVQFIDRVGTNSYRWWVERKADKTKFLRNHSHTLNLRLKDEFSKHGFYTYLPGKDRMGRLIPKEIKNNDMRRQDHLFAGVLFKAPLVITGSVRIGESRETIGASHIQIQLTVIHSGNGRVVAEVDEEFETEVGDYEKAVTHRLASAYVTVAKDIGVQVMQAWKRGTFGARLLRLAVKGPLDFKGIEAFKKSVKKDILEIKNLRERAFETNRVVFEIDSVADEKKLAEKFKEKKVSGFNVQVVGIENNTLTLNVVQVQ